ncbi:MAG TPA: RNA polymerase sigma factor FliA [Haliangiales bacterium]|nr:RNA polymerase sigma factor FliA [Haliangiales bacterium]
MNLYARTRRGRATRDHLIAEHVDVARRIALRVARRTPDWVSQDDLIAAAMLGLAEAADRYDSTRGEPFIAFAQTRIRGAVLDELRRGDIMPRRVRQTARKVGKAVRDLEQKLGRRPEDEEVAGALDVPVEQYREELERLTHVAVVELDRHAEHMSAEGATADTQLERAQLIAKVKQGLSRLQERDAQVLSLYHVEELSYSEIGKLLGVSESRVCQLHARALARLKAEIEADVEEAA